MLVAAKPAGGSHSSITSGAADPTHSSTSALEEIDLILEPWKRASSEEIRLFFFGGVALVIGRRWARSQRQ